MRNVLKKYIECFEKLELNNIDKLLECLSENVTFIDPFNKFKGRDNVGKILKIMFEKTKKPNFKVVYSLGDKENHIIKWRFSCISMKKKIEFEGLSEIKIKRNLITKHEDFWDSGKNFYCNLPLIGIVFRKIHK